MKLIAVAGAGLGVALDPGFDSFRIPIPFLLTAYLVLSLCLRRFMLAKLVADFWGEVTLSVCYCCSPKRVIGLRTLINGQDSVYKHKFTSDSLQKLANYVANRNKNPPQKIKSSTTTFLVLITRL